MTNVWLVICLLGLTSIQIIESFPRSNNDQREDKLDETQIRSSLSTDSSLSSDLLSMEEKEDTRKCLPKNLLFNALTRNRRASISRPYFHHWRSARENNRHLAKIAAELTPKSNKRAVYEDDQVFNVLANEQQVQRSSQLSDFEVFLRDYLNEKNIDIAYEDTTILCLEQPFNDVLIQDIVNEFRNPQHEKETREQHLTGKDPVWFRYRLG